WSRPMRPVALRIHRLETHLAPANAYWDGGGADNNWTTAANWLGDVAPHPGDDLYFPFGAARQTNVNDFPAGTAFHSFDIEDSYNLTGSAVALSAGLTNGRTASMALPVILTADQTFFNGVGGRFNLTGSIDLNGHALTLFRGDLFTIAG